MSDDVRSYGFIAVLKTRVPSTKRDELEHALSSSTSNLDVNSDGTLIYSDANKHKSFDERSDIYELFIGESDATGAKAAFLQEVVEAGLEVDLGTIQPYNCVWYNGSDCPVSLLTKAQYVKRIGG